MILGPVPSAIRLSVFVLNSLHILAAVISIITRDILGPEVSLLIQIRLTVVRFIELLPDLYLLVIRAVSDHIVKLTWCDMCVLLAHYRLRMPYLSEAARSHINLLLRLMRLIRK